MNVPVEYTGSIFSRYGYEFKFYLGTFTYGRDTIDYQIITFASS